MSKMTRLTEIEIQAKIGAAILQEARKGKAYSDFGKKENEAIADSVMDSFSPAARHELIRQGVENLVRYYLGEKIAECVWSTGKGWALPKDDVLSIIKGLRFADIEDGLTSLETYREELPDLTEEELTERSGFASRFMPLFLAQPEGATLGEIATKKAMQGDKLAMSFIAWRAVE